MKFIFLLEDLKDIPTHNIVYHGTNFVRLYYILIDGMIKPRYFSNSLTASPEIAVGRKAMVTSKEKPSSNMQGILIHFFVDRIIGSKEHRGIKKTPIAEFPNDSLNELTVNKYHIGKEKYDFIIKNIKKYGTQIDSRRIVKKLFLKKFENASIEDKNILNKIIYTYEKLIKETKAKEKEERFYFSLEKKEPGYSSSSSNSFFQNIKYGIKVSPNFMQIEITKDLSNFDSLYYTYRDLLKAASNTKNNNNKEELLSSSELNKKYRKEIYNFLFKKNEDIFIHNKNYEILKEAFEKDLIYK